MPLVLLSIVPDGLDLTGSDSEPSGCSQFGVQSIDLTGCDSDSIGGQNRSLLLQAALRGGLFEVPLFLLLPSPLSSSLSYFQALCGGLFEV